jgi:hypothetical protein
MKMLEPNHSLVRALRVSGKMRLVQTRELLEEIYEDEGLHAAQVLSVANAVAGALSASRAGIRAIGIAYAEMAGIHEKHGVKQVDRLLSNSSIDPEVLAEGWARYVVGDAKDIVVALDWTDFADDNHTTLYLALVTTKGRALPLLWKTVEKTKLKGRTAAIEVALIEQLHACLPADVAITVLADRGFVKAEIHQTLEALGIDYVIRIRQDTVVTSADGERNLAAELVAPNGRTQRLVGATVTSDKRPVGAFVCVKAKKMKEPWCLITSLSDKKAADVVALYGRRFTVEETFRDIKNLNFGMGLSATHIRSAARRDRMLLLIAMAQALLTLLGEASERSGVDRHLKVNTVKARTMSLLSQGTRWWRRLHDLRDDCRVPLLEAYDQILREHGFLSLIHI